MPGGGEKVLGSAEKRVTPAGLEKGSILQAQVPVTYAVCEAAQQGTGTASGEGPAPALQTITDVPPLSYS